MYDTVSRIIGLPSHCCPSVWRGLRAAAGCIALHCIRELGNRGRRLAALFLVAATLAACGDSPADADIADAVVAAIRRDASLHGLRDAEGALVTDERLAVHDLVVHETIDAGEYWRATIAFTLQIGEARYPQDVIVSLRANDGGSWTVFRMDAR